MGKRIILCNSKTQWVASTRVHPEPVGGRQTSGSNEHERIYRSIYKGIGEEIKDNKRAPLRGSQRKWCGCQSFNGPSCPHSKMPLQGEYIPRLIGVVWYACYTGLFYFHDELLGLDLYDSMNKGEFYTYICVFLKISV